MNFRGGGWQLLVIPELFGHGTRLFEGHALRRNLERVETRVMDTGAVLQRYRVHPVRRIEGAAAQSLTG